MKIPKIFYEGEKNKKVGNAKEKNQIATLRDFDFLDGYGEKFIQTGEKIKNEQIFGNDE
jgi:hypothetical protein